ncbi:SusD/RagB family nutrient-binding outer membrane lipoprotein [Chitinophaga filiformis]|uniref:SusD/RagB family nutrient-binding outer membrane lipoprotein n=1 Tax=Chitinophaga filiformis TaxID=104663 RepID=UPI001F436284|nr:SusD/RagB family nutrient-binding outer membrane lipoprotein [Chitinophaga filiformis]MCF6403858.1 SusD/RagB family nutrient-binding outer membrane lipoprotein [Chitinophaga filiformis]
MKKIFLYASLSIAGMVSTVSCTKDLTSLNNDVKKPDVVAASALYASATKELADLLTSTSVNLNIYRLIVQQWTENTYLDESNYNLIKRSIPDAVWSALYTDVLKDLSEARKVVEADASISAATKKNQLAQIEIMSIFATSVAVNTFGNVPYSKSLDIDNLFPVYEDGLTIYNDLLTRLDAALTSFDASAEGFGTANMLFPGDEINSWIKFGNSLKFRLGMTLVDAAPDKAAAAVTAAEPKAFNTMGEFARFPYSTVPPNTNPLWEDLVQSGRHDFNATTLMINQLKTLNDPRIGQFFTTVDGQFIGLQYGTKGSYVAYSHPGDKLERKDLPGVFIDYSEIEFLRAEAIERGLITGVAATHYNNAITNSIVSWGGTAAEAVTYLAQPSVAYATATGTYKQKIGLQKWIALYNRGFDAWVEARRLDYPVFVPGPTARSPWPVRFTYPVSEQNLNRTNYDKAAKDLGGDGDRVTTKIFWDK